MKRLLLAALVITAGPASAGWQGAEWGMTVEEARGRIAPSVPGLSTGPGSPLYSSDQHFARLVGTYRAGSHQFALAVGFDAAHRLGIVELRPADMSKCWALRADLRDRYGVAHEAPSTAIFEVNRWRVPAENNVVELNIMKGTTTTCTLKYRPLSTANTRGL